MSLLGDIIGGITGLLSDKKTNKINKAQLDLQQKLADRQIDISKYMEEIVKQMLAKNYSFNDPYGAAPGTLNPQEKGIQDESYKIELARMKQDQAARSAGLADFEDLREMSVGEAKNSLADILAFKRGVNRVDDRTIASQLRADRTGAVNAGYDDAARAMQTLGLRTGSSAAGDALAAIARDRGRAIATTMGSPEVEAIKLAQDVNSEREGNLLDFYKQFSGEGRGFYDAAFTPSTYANQAYARLTDANKFDLSKYDLALGGSGSAASTVGNAAAQYGAAQQAFMKNRIANPWGNFATGMDAAMDDAAKSIFKAIAGGM